MTEPVLYIVMREDLWDMNPGKGMAQAAHAQAEFDAYIEDNPSSALLEHVNAWKDRRKFGTTIVLHAPTKDIERIGLKLEHFGLTVDPTYPYKNWYGKVFTRPELTCAWAFAVTDQEIEFMKQFDLHR